MKKGKPFIFAIILTMILAMFLSVNSPIAVNAANQNSTESRKTEIAEKKAKFATKKEEFEAYKVQLKANLKTCILNRKGNIDIKVENVHLAEELANSLEAIKEKEIVLDEETAAKIEALTTELKTLKAGLIKDSGNIKGAMAEYKGYVKDKDYVSMEATFEKIFEAQKIRLEQLTKINSVLKEMITLLAAYA